MDKRLHLTTENESFKSSVFHSKFLLGFFSPVKAPDGKNIEISQYSLTLHVNKPIHDHSHAGIFSAKQPKSIKDHLC